MELVGQTFIWALIWIGGLVILVILFWVFVRMSNPENTRKNPSLKEDQDKNRKDMLKDRFARGEIGKKEYEERLRSVNKLT
ncbi:MAG: hypothetical protein KFF73_09900 [Cyclobacteriaceae bacterium]|nr:hypothetical protein [Cyclobacteriaceae bacterium]